MMAEQRMCLCALGTDETALLTSLSLPALSQGGWRSECLQCSTAKTRFPLKAFQNCTCTRWKGLFTSLIHAAFWPERMPRARKWKRATISGARGSAGRRRAVVGGAAEFPNGSVPRDPRQDVQGKPVDILRGKSGLGRRSSPIYAEKQ